MRLYVTGTDTDVGKTRVTAALAAMCVARGENVTIVKAVQTGLAPGVPGDAAEAGALAGCAAREFARFRLPADPWSAAQAENAPLLDATRLAAQIEAVAGTVIVEGAGGAAVPINPGETLTTVIAQTSCAAVVVTGMRLGCISHTLLTLAYLAAHGVPVHGVVLVERWGPCDAGERARIGGAIETRAPILALIEYDLDAPRSVARAATLLDKVGTRA
jgi:dethiobiotin synthase